MATKSKKLWGGRFTESTDKLVEEFTESVSFDRRIYAEDIEASTAHAKMLEKIGVLTSSEHQKIETGLNRIRQQIEDGEFEWSTQQEDVHMNIEAKLTEMIGEAGKKLHTARSRNDQVATDMRLYLRRRGDDVVALLQQTQNNLLDLAEKETATIMPGYTHLQVAQPVSLAHHLLAWVEMFERDRERFSDARRRTNVMPLGSAALAGTSFSIDREYTADLLGFDRPARNSLDAVSDRDFLIEFVAHASLVMIHLSRICEELIIWSSQAWGFVEISDAFCTGSSIMPQKKNPDVTEIIRGKCARVIGSLNALLVLMKSQPLAYNRDNQEDKEPVFDTVDTLQSCLTIFAALVPNIQFKREQMREAALQGYATATDLADYLVRKHIPFREAHAIVGKIVHQAIESNSQLSELSLEQLQSHSELIAADVFDILTLEGSLASRNHLGGTSKNSVRLALADAKRRIHSEST